MRDNNEKPPKAFHRILSVVETAIVWLFLLQALRVLFSSLFGVIYDTVFDESLNVFVVIVDIALIVLAMLTPLLVHRFEGQSWPRVAAVFLVAGSRFFLSIDDPAIHLYAAMLLLAGAAFYVSHVFLHEPSRLLVGLVVGLGAEQLLRALDHTFDPSLRPEGLLLVLAPAAILAFISPFLARKPIPTARDQPGLKAGIALGAGLFVQMSLLGLPNAVGHWTASAYSAVAPLLVLVTLSPVVPAARGVEWIVGTFLWPMSGLFSIAVVLMCIALAAMLGGPFGAVLLLTAQLIFIFTFTTAVLDARSERGKHRVGLETSLGLIVMLGFSFALAFTYTYAYTFAIFRGMGTPVLLLGTFVAMLPLLSVSRGPEFQVGDLRPSFLGLVGIVLLSLLCAVSVRPQFPSKTPVGKKLRLATYNIHYGYGEDWVYNLERIADTIADSDIDVAVLQEVDVGRVTSLSVDQALWLSQRLGMHYVYQPTLEKLSGIALLSRYPLLNAGGQLLTSSLEQTAIVHATVDALDKPLDVYGVWLGLDAKERATQVSEALAYIGNTEPAALGGDMNATPDSPVYAQLLDAGFRDPAEEVSDRPRSAGTIANSPERIDYVLLRGVDSLQTWASDLGASDHPLVAVEVQFNP